MNTMLGEKEATFHGMYTFAIQIMCLLLVCIDTFSIINDMLLMA